ncbi:MAG: hypothetical protein ABIZ91_15500 [Gemmatimonadaceae bacterium]
MLLPEDVAAFKAFKTPTRPQYAFVSSLDAISAARCEFRSMVDDGPLLRWTTKQGGHASGGLADMPSHAILDRG